MHKRTQLDHRVRGPGRRRSRSPSLPRGLVLALIALSLAAPGAQARMYRWVDETGATVYSQQPPPQGAATQIRADPAPSAEEAARARERINTAIESDFDKRDEAARQAEAARKDAEDQAKRSANCKAARGNLETIQNLGARRLRTPDGEYRYLSDAERDKLAAEARAQIEENCK